MTDASSLSNNWRGKNLQQLSNDIDSMTIHYDSIGQSYMASARISYYRKDSISKKDSMQVLKIIKSQKINFDSLFVKQTDTEKRTTFNTALSKAQQEVMDLEFKQLITSDGDWLIRRHKIEEWSKFTLALSCLIFFFIGAPLGAIIRKGGLGVPIIAAVLVYIVFYILDNTGSKMARDNIWAIWFGKALAPAVLIPLAIFVTYKANNDSVVFNFDIWKNLFMRMMGFRVKRHVYGKEVIIQDPDYTGDAEKLSDISSRIVIYSQKKNLKAAPDVIKVFFRYNPDHEIEHIGKELETIIENLSNTRDKVILAELNTYPIIATKAHTRPFERQWMNVIAAICVPAGIFFYFRMWRFRLRLLKDLRGIRQTNANIISRIGTITQGNL